MPSAVKDLTALNSTVELILNDRPYTKGSCQYISGAGTVQVECTNQVTDPAIWFIPVDTDDETAVVAQTQVGVKVFDVFGYARMRVRKTVGTASCVVGLGVS